MTANKRLEIDALGIAQLSLRVRPTADGRANGVAGEPRWLRPPAAAEPADGTDGPAGHGSPATPLSAQYDTIINQIVRSEVRRASYPIARLCGRGREKGS